MREKQLFASEYPSEAEIPEGQKKDTKYKQDFVIIIYKNYFGSRL